MTESNPRPPSLSIPKLAEPLADEQFAQDRQRLQEAFERYLLSTVESALVEVPERLAEAIRYSLLAPGKRLRPLLTLWGAELVGGNYEDALPAAVAVEMIHCYSLVHDDLPAMDNDDLRRGLPTCHRFDEATAILAGDALQPLAFSVLLNHLPSPAIAVSCCKLLAQAAGPSALVGGQMEDLQCEGRPWSIEETQKLRDDQAHAKEVLSRIHANKTGAMIHASLVLGAMCGEATPAELKAIGTYGEKIGLVFQIVDDLLDVLSSDETMGKRTGKDSEAGKLTYPGLYGVEESKRAAEDYTREAVEALEVFGLRARTLQYLARYMLERTH
jgi:geranylgeranyl diphosphate synthase, type II